MTEKLARPDTSHFACLRCGECCRIKGGIVRIADKDVAAIAAALSVSESEFIDRWCDIAPDRKGLVLKDAADGHSCIMLDESNRCRIYAARPEKCRTFPFEWMNDNSADYCPGLCPKNLAPTSYQEQRPLTRTGVF